MHAIIHVFTYKAGLLARMAHDLRLTATRHELTLQGRHVRGFCAADSLSIDGVVNSRGLDTQALSESDKRQITDTIRTEILQTDRHPRIEFEGEVSGSPAAGPLRVSGTLRVRGQARPISAELVRKGDRLQASFELTPTQFGIPPYKALAGAIKLQDRLVITVDVLLGGQNPDGILASSDPLQLIAASEP